MFKLRKSIYYEEVINKLLPVISVYNRLGHRQQVFVGRLTLRHLMTCANGEIISAQYVRDNILDHAQKKLAKAVKKSLSYECVKSG